MASLQLLDQYILMRVITFPMMLSKAHQHSHSRRRFRFLIRLSFSFPILGPITNGTLGIAHATIHCTANQEVCLVVKIEKYFRLRE
jgi:hypothetical protein